MNLDLVRDTAVRVLVRVFEQGAYLDLAVDAALRRRTLTDRGHRFMTQLVYGTVRHLLLCEHVLNRLLREPAGDLPPPVRAILRMGVFQALFCKQVTFPAMVHTSVDLVRHHSHAGLARVANAVLRRVPQRIDDAQLPAPDKDFTGYLSIRHSMPRWLVEEWLDEFGPETAEALCVASNSEAHATIRTNTLATTPEHLVEALNRLGKSGGYLAKKTTVVPEEVTLSHGAPSVRSKLFQQGWFMVQDPASMLPAHLLEPKAGERVLDMCAAPGGKTTHLAQLAGNAALIVAMDRHANRLPRIADNVGRLHIKGVHLVCGDGLSLPLNAVFDRVLVDAPCTGIGTLRRHPDLKWRATPQGREELARLQTALLRNAVRVCKNQGHIVYSVCTTTRQETLDVVQAVLQTEKVIPEDGPEWFTPWKTGPGQYRTLPTAGDWDGFFLMRFRKAS
ncbi:MAG TPA: 16S rRNA (cytosine(967)-C(5))-methyltransferase RsmB [Candidatus Hydrogenedentes bacterium]|nr:16S rRNA (cytosine(967)-C(5))-methyltransferase RsmB [Candidatus Hydrogenedentota bacterium]